VAFSAIDPKMNAGEFRPPFDRPPRALFLVAKAVSLTSIGGKSSVAPPTPNNRDGHGGHRVSGKLRASQTQN